MSPISSVREWLGRLLGTVSPRRSERDLENELRSHLELAAEAARRLGTSPDDMAPAVRRRTGGMPQALEALRDQQTLPGLRDLGRDTRYAVRGLRRAPVFTAVAVLSLAIGIGANTGIYAVVRTLLFEPLPVRSPEELALVYWRDPGDVRINQMSASGYQDPSSGLQYRSNVSYPIYESLQRSGLANVSLAGFSFLRDVSVSFGDRPAVLAGGLVADGNYFHVTGAGIAMGRALDVTDDVEGVPVAAVISHAFWMRALGGDLSVLGRAVHVNAVPVTIVGVTAEGFQGLSKGGFFSATEITLPLRATPRLMPRWQPDAGSLWTAEQRFWVRLLARVPAGVSTGALAQQVAATLSPHLTPLMERGTPNLHVQFAPGARGLDQVSTDTRGLLFVLMGVVGVVLLIACTNLAGLMLVRGMVRQREFATRRALGAGRAQLMRPLLLEGLCLALAGGAGGLLLTFLTKQWLLTTVLTAGLGTAPPPTLKVAMDGGLIAWTFGLSIVAALLCSVMPAVRLTRFGGMALELRHRTMGVGAQGLTLARGLIAIQIAASVPLLVGAALFLQTLSNLGRVELGFNPERLAFFKLVPPPAISTSLDQAAPLYRAVLERVRALPGVASATLMENVLLSGIVSDTRVLVEGREERLYRNAVGPDMLDTLGLEVVAGRAPDIQDVPGAPRVAAINQAAATRLFGAAPAVGQVVMLHGDDEPMHIVGVISDTRYDSPRADVRPIMFDAALQRKGNYHLVIRTSAAPASLELAIAPAVAEVHPDLPVANMKTQVAQIQEAVARERVFAQVLTTFGGFALLLVCIGLHGVTSYAVSRRRNEIGVRVALGARPGQVQWLVLRQVVVLGIVGLAVGVPLAAATTPLASSLLFGVAPTNAIIIGVSAGVMLLVAVTAGLIPARRAATMDPLAALRAE